MCTSFTQSVANHPPDEHILQKAKQISLVQIWSAHQRDLKEVFTITCRLAPFSRACICNFIGAPLVRFTPTRLLKQPSSPALFAPFRPAIPPSARPSTRLIGSLIPSLRPVSHRILQPRRQKWGSPTHRPLLALSERKRGRSHPHLSTWRLKTIPTIGGIHSISAPTPLTCRPAMRTSIGRPPLTRELPRSGQCRATCSLHMSVELARYLTNRSEDFFFSC